jgi:hypothetical protein
MKYMFLLFGEEGTWAAMSEEERQAEYARHGALAEELAAAGKTPAGDELAPSAQARTLRLDGAPGSPTAPSWRPGSSWGASTSSTAPTWTRRWSGPGRSP